MKLTEYIRRSISKTSHKKWEHFVVSRVLHRLNDFEIEFVTQQLVLRENGKRALTDMFFPQFGIHVEVDEPGHKNQVAEDEMRERDIVSITQHSVVRFPVSDNSDLHEICDRVDAFVERLKALKAEQVSRGIFQPWDYETRFMSAPVIARGYLDVEDNVTFRRQDEAMRCFGFKGKGWQKGAWKISDGSGDLVWFPRLYQHDERWNNRLSHDGKTLAQEALNDVARDHNLQSLEDQKSLSTENRVIVFAKAKDSLGANLLRYVGTFSMDRDASSQDALIYQRIATRESVRP